MRQNDHFSSKQGDRNARMDLTNVHYKWCQASRALKGAFLPHSWEDINPERNFKPDATFSKILSGTLAVN